MNTEPDQMDTLDSEQLQADLLKLFQWHGVDVAVGLTKNGVAIRSQDERVDAANIGVVRAE